MLREIFLWLFCVLIFGYQVADICGIFANIEMKQRVFFIVHKIATFCMSISMLLTILK